MQYVVNFTSMQYMSTSVDTGTEGTLSTIVACGAKPGCQLYSPAVVKQLSWRLQVNSESISFPKSREEHFQAEGPAYRMHVLHILLQVIG